VRSLLLSAHTHTHTHLLYLLSLHTHAPHANTPQTHTYTTNQPINRPINHALPPLAPLPLARTPSCKKPLSLPSHPLSLSVFCTYLPIQTDNEPDRQIDRQTAVTLKRREALSDRQTRKTTHPPHTRASASQPYETQQPFCVSFERSFIKNSIHPSIHWHPPAQTPKGPLAACTSEADRNSHIHTYQEGIVELVACSVMFVQRDNRCAALPHTHTHAHTRIGLRRECTITNKRAARLPQTYRAISQSVRLVYTAPSHTRVCPSPSQQPAGVQSLQTNAASSKDRITGTHHSQKQKQTDRQQNTTEHPSK